MKRRRNPSLIIAVVMLVAVGMIIGYAYLSKTLNINGTIGVTRNTWNVKFRNIQVENGSVEAAAPTLSNSDRTITITPTLDTFGDYYEFTVEVYNEGSIDAMLQAVPANPLSTEQQKLLEWSLTYDDGIALTQNDILKSKESDTLRVRVAYKTDVNEEDLASASTSSISFTITYVQADSNSQERRLATGAELLVFKSNPASATYMGVSDDKKKEMFAFEHVAPTTITDYRYIGKQGEDGPNNYITFNDEVWRIIGVFDGKIKIIRNKGIDNDATISWDYKESGLGSSSSGNGSNDWSDAQLMYLLNRQYVDGLLKVNYTKSGDLIKDANGNVIYRIGYRPASQCLQDSYTGTDTTTWTGLTDIANNQVAEVTWNLGGLPWNSSTWGAMEEMYQAERGTNVSSGRPTTWTGRIALMYPTDYGYTFGKGVEEGCYKNSHNCSGNGDPTKSWLYLSTKGQWMLSPVANSSHPYVFWINPTGSIHPYGYARETYVVYPCVYLKSSIRLQGSGTTTDPYTIVN